MSASLNNSEVDYRRHFSCELCSKDVTGGYDPSLNQIVICSNRCGKRMTQGVLAHELLHMYDYCRAHLDFNNLEHVACTEVCYGDLLSQEINKYTRIDSSSKLNALFHLEWYVRWIC